MEQKIDQKYLDQIKQIQEKYNEISLAYGILYVQKKQIDEEISKVDKNYNDIRQQELNLLKELNEKYGEVDFDFNKGDIKTKK